MTKTTKKQITAILLLDRVGAKLTPKNIEATMRMLDAQERVGKTVTIIEAEGEVQ